MPARIPRFSHLDARAAGKDGTNGPLPLAKGVSVDAKETLFNAEVALLNDDGVLVNAKEAVVNAERASTSAEGALGDGGGTSVNGVAPRRSARRVPWVAALDDPRENSRCVGNSRMWFGQSTEPWHTASMARFILAWAMVVATPAMAQWTVTNLHPVDATTSVIEGAGGTRQTGSITLGGLVRASLWNGTAASWVSLHPAGATESRAWGTNGQQQVGRATVGGAYHASLWQGTAASWVSLRPFGITNCDALGTDGTRQVGYSFVGGIAHASVWSGTATSWVDLHPAGATQGSYAYAVDGSQQVGYADNHACLWSGSASSWIDLHPHLVANYSAAYTVSGGRQAGVVNIGGLDHASLWSGSVASWVDVHPAGASRSRIYAMSASYQVGYAEVGPSIPQHASLWSGTAASWIDLHVFLPAQFTVSIANGISSDGTTLYVSGNGYNSVTRRNEALLWTRPLSGLCIADVDNGTGTGTPDGGVTIEDLLYYLTIYADGLARADLDDGSNTGTPDGGVTIDDLLYYLVRYEAGC